MTVWFGATHASKPYPVKLPGAGGAAAWAGEDIRNVAARPVRMPVIVSREVGEDTKRILREYVPRWGMSGICDVGLPLPAGPAIRCGRRGPGPSPG